MKPHRPSLGTLVLGAAALALLAAPRARANFNVGIVSTSDAADGGNPANLASELMGTGLFTSVDLLSGTETNLSSYNAILVFSNEPGDFSAAGDNLASYVGAGGHVVLATFFWQTAYAGFPASGFGNLQNAYYDPFNGYAGNYSAATLGAVNAASPVIDGPAGQVTSLSGYYRDQVTLNGDASLVASWSDGDPLAAVAPSGDVGITLFPDDSLGQVSGDYLALFSNALLDTPNSSTTHPVPDGGPTWALAGLGLAGLLALRRSSLPRRA